MPSDKPPPALSIPQSANNVSNNSSPRSLGTSILNSHSSTTPNGSLKVKTPTGPNAPTPQSIQHSLPNLNIPSPQHNTQPYHPSNPGPGSLHSSQFAYSSDPGFMNSQSNTPYVGLDFSHHHNLSQGQPPTPQTATSGSNMSFPPQPPVLQPSYSQPHHGFPPFFSSQNGVSSPAGQPGVSGPMPVHATQQLLPLPQNSQMTPSPSPLTSVSQGGPQTPSSATSATGFGNQPPFDTTGQHAPPGMKPRVTATLWEDEGSLCFQVEAKGVCVARREDNHMINGTKLLNVAGMTRGRRDGILKSEKVRHVVKIGPMHLKGVWIPFDRALDFANKEKITELLYPLFVHNIGALLYHPANTNRTNAVMAAAHRRQQDNAALQQQQQSQMQRRNTSELVPSSQPPMHHHHAMQHPMHTSLPPHTNLAPHPPQNQLQRPGLERSISFPTPPSSASSVMGVGNSESPTFWNGNMVSSVGGTGGQSSGIDTVMNSARSMPTTPATTPPGGTLQQLQQYPPAPPLYSSNPSAMPQHSIAQQNMQRFGQPLAQPPQYMNQRQEPSPMGPPSSRGPPAPLSRPSSRQNTADDTHPKEENVEEQTGLAAEGEEHEDHGEEEAEHEPEHEEEYTHDPNYANGHRTGNYYPSMQGDHAPHLSPEMTGSPNHGGQGPSTPARSTYTGSSVSVPRTVDGGSGATPRTTNTSQQWVQGGYSTPPRANSTNGNTIRQPPTRNPYQLVNGGQEAAADHNGPNGTGAPDNGYQGQPGMGVSMPAQGTPQTFAVNGASTPGSNKRIREMDDEDEHGSRPSSRGHDERSGGDSEGGISGLKRRKTMREGSTPTVGGINSSTFDRNADGRLNRTRSAIGTTRGRR
ncbi:unnamed protein product [Tuber aestivum]|uniref:HTH APSES-type domain-containing protein n=1 Tax=Tuber aestivum TaxID=59557 RepID=A0A292PLC2_9PEZI|nr:unnamed protein product [Tuber aestivum]